MNFWQNFGPESKKQLKLAMPIVLGQVGQNLISLTDTIMVGRLGAVALAASAFASSFFIIFLIFGFGVLAPLAPLFARIEGAGRHRDSDELLKHAVILTVIMAFFLIGVLYVIMPFLDHFGQTTEVLTTGHNFYQIIAWSLLPSLLFQVYRQFTDGIGDTKAAMTLMLAGVVLNIAGNAILIPILGLDGSGLSTLICRTLMAIAMMIYVHRRPYFRKYLSQAWTVNWDWTSLIDTFKMGLPTGLTFLFEVGAFASAAIVMGIFGTQSLAAHQIAISLASITFLVTSGIGVAASIRVGFELGQNQNLAARHAGFTSVTIGAVYMALCGLFFFVLRSYLPTLYIQDAQVIELASRLLLVTAFFEVFDGVQSVVIGALRGLADTFWPSILAFVSYWILGLPLGALIAFKLGYGPIGVWIGLLIGLIFISLFLTVRFHILSRTSSVK